MGSVSRLLAVAFGPLAAITLACTPSPALKSDPVRAADLLPPTREAPASSFPSALEWPTLSRAGSTAGIGTGQSVRPPYRIGPMDQVVVMVWGRPDLGSQVPVAQDGKLRATVVREDGTLLLPFLAPLKVSGNTIEEARSKIQAGYAAVIENPQVEVALFSCASQSIEVAGAVIAPGTYYVCENRLTLGEILTFARGLAPTADLAHGVLTREDKPYRLDYRGGERGVSVAADLLVQNGDRVYFPNLNERLVYVFGEVKRQGAFPIPPRGITVLEALGLAEGIDTNTFDTGGVFVMRREGNAFVAHRIAFADLLQTENIPMEDGDRLFVATNSLERWSRFWLKAIPFLRIYIHSGNASVTLF